MIKSLTRYILKQRSIPLFYPSLVFPSIHRLVSKMSTLPQPAASTQSAPSTSIPSTTTKPIKQQEKKEKKPKASNTSDGSSSLVGQMSSLELEPKPEFIGNRIEMFDKLFKEYNEFVANQEKWKLKSLYLMGKF